jgi:hypothetical protein
MPLERQLWVTLLLSLLALVARPAAAQDYLGEPQAVDAFSWPGRTANHASAALNGFLREPGAAPPSAEEADAGLPARTFLKRSPAAPPAALARLTRLAGMFMGRVSPWSVGGMRICIKLDIL